MPEIFSSVVVSGRKTSQGRSPSANSAPPKNAHTCMRSLVCSWFAVTNSSPQIVEPRPAHWAMDHADGEAPAYLWTPEPTGWKSRCLMCLWRSSAFLLTGTFPAAAFHLYVKLALLASSSHSFILSWLFCPALVAEAPTMGRFLTCSSSSQSKFHFLSDHCWFDKPLRNQTKDKNNGLSDYSYTDLHYLNWVSHLGGCQQG